MTVRITSTTLRDVQQSLPTSRMRSEGMPPNARQITLEMLDDETDSNRPRKHRNIPL